jgi:hypothetical protein
MSHILAVLSPQVATIHLLSGLKVEEPTPPACSTNERNILPDCTFHILIVSFISDVVTIHLLSGLKEADVIS